MGTILDGDVADLGEEAVEDRAVEEDVPAGAGGLAEDDVGDVLLLGEADERVGDVAVGEGDDLGAEVAGHALVLLEAVVGFGVAVAFVVVGRVT